MKIGEAIHLGGGSRGDEAHLFHRFGFYQRLLTSAATSLRVGRPA